MESEEAGGRASVTGFEMWPVAYWRWRVVGKEADWEECNPILMSIAGLVL